MIVYESALMRVWHREGFDSKGPTLSSLLACYYHRIAIWSWAAKMQRALPHALRHLANRQAKPAAHKLVLGIIAQNAPVTVQDLYKLTTQEQEKLASSSDPHSLPVPSMRCAPSSPTCALKELGLQFLFLRQVLEEGSAA